MALKRIPPPPPPDDFWRTPRIHPNDSDHSSAPRPVVATRSIIVILTGLALLLFILQMFSRHEQANDTSAEVQHRGTDRAHRTEQDGNGSQLASETNADAKGDGSCGNNIQSLDQVSGTQAPPERTSTRSSAGQQLPSASEMRGSRPRISARELSEIEADFLGGDAVPVGSFAIHEQILRNYRNIVRVLLILAEGVQTADDREYLLGLKARAQAAGDSGDGPYYTGAIMEHARLTALLTAYFTSHLRGPEASSPAAYCQTVENRLAQTPRSPPDVQAAALRMAVEAFLDARAVFVSDADRLALRDIERNLSRAEGQHVAKQAELYLDALVRYLSVAVPNRQQTKHGTSVKTVLAERDRRRSLACDAFHVIAAETRAVADLLFLLARSMQES